MAILLLPVGACGTDTSNLPPGTILILGDSLSAGYNLPIEQAWPTLMQQALLHEGHDYQVVNASISGDTTAGGKSRLGGLLERHSPTLVMIELGANDALRGQPLRLMQSNLAAMIELAQDRSALVMLLGMQLPPNYGLEYSREFRQVYADLAERYDTPLMPFLLQPIATSFDYFLEDGLHPNAAGQHRISTAVYSALNQAYRLTPP